MRIETPFEIGELVRDKITDRETYVLEMNLHIRSDNETIWLIKIDLESAGFVGFVVRNPSQLERIKP